MLIEAYHITDQLWNALLRPKRLWQSPAKQLSKNDWADFSQPPSIFLPMRFALQSKNKDGLIFHLFLALRFQY